MLPLLLLLLVNPMSSVRHQQPPHPTLTLTLTFAPRYDFGNEYTRIDRRINQEIREQVERSTRDTAARNQQVQQQLDSNRTLMTMRRTGGLVYGSMTEASKRLPYYQVRVQCWGAGV